MLKDFVYSLNIGLYSILNVGTLNLNGLPIYL
jgi:hypothetical protein